MKRVVLIGPVLPFRGGVSQHTTMLGKELSTLSELLILSFARQYPAWLFPGRSDKEGQIQEYNGSGIRYMIDSLNPLSWRAAIDECRRYKAEMIIIPWWTSFWFPCFWYIARTLRNMGKQITFICHNVFEHEALFWKTALTKTVLQQGSKHIVHSHQDKNNLVNLMNCTNVKVHPHPVFDHYPKVTGSLKKRANLELLFFGFVRPYKGLDLLVEAMAKLDRQDFFLTIAGEFWSDELRMRDRIANLGLTRKIEIIPRYLANQEVAECFSRADLVILPYRSATGSGVLSLSYNYNKPVLITRVGGLPELVIEGESGFIVEPNAPAQLAQVIDKVSPEELAGMKAVITKLKLSLTWRSLAQTILED